MAAKLPPISPANRSPGLGREPPIAAETRRKTCDRRNLSVQGRQGNIHQNTTNHQQER